MEVKDIKFFSQSDKINEYLPNFQQKGYKSLVASLKTGKMAPHTITTSTQHSKQEIIPTKVGQNLADPVNKVAKELAMDIVKYVSTNRNVKPHSNTYAKTMRRTVDEISARHEILFNGMMTKLHITKENARETFENVIAELFSDNQYNWGRVVVVYAFGGRLAKFCVEMKMPDFVDTVGEIVGNYVSEQLSSWIREQGGWEAFEQYFPEQNSLEDKIWRGLIFTAVGLGALATMAAVR